jgi:hypothetical protein
MSVRVVLSRKISSYSTLVPPIDEPPKSPLSDKLTTPAVFGHLEELYAIALKHNNSRSVTNGYMASADYVQTQLGKKAHKYCDISTQEFKVPVWSELETPELTSMGIGSVDSHVIYQNKVDFQSESAGHMSANTIASSLLSHDTRIMGRILPYG